MTTGRVNLKEVMVTGLCPKCHKYRLTRNVDGDMECLCGFLIYSNGLTSVVDPISRYPAVEIEKVEEETVQPAKAVIDPSWTTTTGALDTTKLPKATMVHGMQRVLCNGCGIEFDKPGATITGGRRSFHNWACMMDADGKKRAIDKPDHTRKLGVAPEPQPAPPATPLPKLERAPQLNQQQIDGIKDYDWCLKSLQLTQAEMLSIQAQVRVAEGDIKAGRTVDRDWFSRLNKARVHHSQQYGALSFKLSQLKREQNHVRANNFERIFMSSAQTLLPKEVFDTIFKQAMDNYVVSRGTPTQKIERVTA